MPTDTTNYTSLIDLAAGQFRDQQGDADGDADGEQFAADDTGTGPAATGPAPKLGAGDGDEHSDGRRGDADDRGDYVVTADFVPTDTTNYTR